MKLFQTLNLKLACLISNAALKVKVPVMGTGYLSKESEKAFARSFHENKLVLGLRIGTVRIKTKNELSFWIINNETVAGEEHGSFVNSQMSFLLKAESLVHDRYSAHLFGTAIRYPPDN